MSSMGSLYSFVAFLSLLVFNSLTPANSNITSGTEDGLEQWGYVEVRPKAHLFWWLYRSPHRVEDPSNPWPTILWVEGGPGSSGIGLGNFLEIGPLDANLKQRNSTWLLKADLLFLDSPVGTGFSYVEDENLAVRTDEEAATDLTTLLKTLYNGNETLQKSPLFIFGQSYGGKFAVTLGVSATKAIQAGELKVQLGGVALGNAWISPEDFVFSWGPLLRSVSRIDNNGLRLSNSLAQKIQKQLAEGKSVEARETWSDLRLAISKSSNYVDLFNFMFDGNKDPIIPRYNSTEFYNFMNGPVKQKLKIIPENVIWGGQTGTVTSALVGDLMNPRIKEVDELLAKGINVSIYNGQLDVTCSTMGVESWVNKLKWDGLGTYLNLGRTPLYCGEGDTSTKGFVRSYKNLAFYWILGAGHAVPADQPCVSLQMMASITRSPSDK